MKIAIVGLGAAGARAAMLLAGTNHEVELYEARERIGGRLHTITVGNGFYEAGGEWIDADHERILGVLDDFGQKPEASDQWPGRVCYRGDVAREDQLWPDAEDAQSMMEEAADLLCLDLDPDAAANIHASELDEQTLGSWLDRLGATARGRWWLEASLRSDEGDDTDQIGLLGWLVGWINYQERNQGAMSAFRFPEGAQRFCERMVKASGFTPRLNCPLQRVEREGDQVFLYFENHQTKVDRVILTLPPPALREIIFDPPVHEDLENAIDECGMSRAIKFSLHFREPFWRSQGRSVRTFADSRIQQVWDATRSGGTPTINCYICGDGARDISLEPNPIQSALNDFEEICPGAKEYFVDGSLHNWIDDRWAGGAFSHLAPGFVLGGLKFLSRPQGRIHFAGEHTSSWTGFIEGALESAERAVIEVLSN